MPLNIDWQQILIHLFNFFLLLALLTHFLYEPVLNFMKSREEHYKEMDKTYSEKLEQAEELINENKKKLENSDQEIRAYKDRKMQELSKDVEEKLASARLEGDKIIDEAKTKASLERTKTIESAKKDIKEMALETTKKLLHRSEEKDIYDEFIEYGHMGEEKDE